MTVITRRPNTPSQRFYQKSDTSALTNNKPAKALRSRLNKTAGRNNSGKITSRHRGGGARRHYRLIDLDYSIRNITGIVKEIAYDPNRTAYLILVQYPDGRKQYLPAIQDLKVGDSVIATDEGSIKIGANYPLKAIPAGTVISNVEKSEGSGSAYARSAGTFAVLAGFEGDKAQIKLPSGEVRIVDNNCRATIGVVSNPENNVISLGKAGRKRHLGRRPVVRGKAQNPVDHPHGGGEGSNPIGMSAPKSKWGQLALGQKTRNKRKNSSMVLRARGKKKR